MSEIPRVVRYVSAVGAAIVLAGCVGEAGQVDGPRAANGAVGADATRTPGTGAEGLPGTVKDGSDAAILADVDSGLTHCGGLKHELWANKPYTPDHMFDYYGANPDMVKAAKNFWEDVMGADAFSFLVDKAVANKDASSKKTTGDSQMDEFTRKHIANSDVPEGTVESNHNCVDTDGDGKADTIKFLDLRLARHGNRTEEGHKRTTLSGLVLHQADFDQFVAKMRAAGKDPSDLITYPLNLDANDDHKITADERYVFVATNSAICENAELRHKPTEKPTPTSTTPPRTHSSTPTPPETTPPTYGTKQSAHPAVPGEPSSSPVESPPPQPYPHPTEPSPTNPEPTSTPSRP